MKQKNFTDYNLFQIEVENFKKRNEFFFVDTEKEIIYTKEENENFLSFYLDVLVLITQFWENELTRYTTTDFHFYLPKTYLTSFRKSFKKDFDMMLDKLGYNFDDYDLRFTDKIGVIY